MQSRNAHHHHPYASVGQPAQLYGFRSGSSMAAPVVAGLAALVWTTPYGGSEEAVRTRIETTSRQTAALQGVTAAGSVVALDAVGAPPVRPSDLPGRPYHYLLPFLPSR